MNTKVTILLLQKGVFRDILQNINRCYIFHVWTRSGKIFKSILLNLFCNIYFEINLVKLLIRLLLDLDFMTLLCLPFWLVNHPDRFELILFRKKLGTLYIVGIFSLLFRYLKLHDCCSMLFFHTFFFHLTCFNAVLGWFWSVFV